jgi:hypothetical protein
VLRRLSGEVTTAVPSASSASGDRAVFPRKARKPGAGGGVGKSSCSFVKWSPVAFPEVAAGTERSQSKSLRTGSRTFE